MTSSRRLLALLACAITVQLSPTGAGGTFASPAAAAALQECAGEPGMDPTHAGMDMSRDGDRPMPCDDGMSDGECLQMPGCVAGASVMASLSRTADARPMALRARAIPVATLLTRVIAPDVPPPRV